MARPTDHCGHPFAQPVAEQQHLSSVAGRHYRFRVTMFVLIGGGWRARMFLKVARELGTIHCGGVVVRTSRRLDVPSFTSLDACLREVAVDFVLTTTPRHVTPHFIAEAVDRGRRAEGLRRRQEGEGP
jgi:hypothetical protein